MDTRPNLRYAIPYGGEEIWPEKQWQWSKDRSFTALASNELVIKKTKGKWTVSYKQYLKDNEGEERSSKPYSIIDSIYTQQGTNEIAEIFGDGKAFNSLKEVSHSLNECDVKSFERGRSTVPPGWLAGISAGGRYDGTVEELGAFALGVQVSRGVRAQVSAQSGGWRDPRELGRELS
jgi:hypothetical protein